MKTAASASTPSQPARTVISDGKDRWEPVVDVNWLVVTAGTVAIAALFVVLHIIRAKAQSR